MITMDLGGPPAAAFPALRRHILTQFRQGDGP